MALVRPLEEEEFDPELLEFVQFFKGPLGVIPNSVRTMARRPDVARAFTNLNIAVMECHGKVTPEFKRLMQADLDHPIETVGTDLRSRMDWLED